jgi:hypothetical protein
VGEGTTVRSRATLGHDDHGHDAEVFYLGLVLDPKYVEGCLEGIGEDDPDEEDLLRGIREDGDDEGFGPEALEGGVEVRAGRP